VSRRKDPESAVVEFFSAAPLATAQTVLTIAKGIVAKRVKSEVPPATQKSDDAEAPR